MTSHVHVLLPGVSRTPIGGYKVAYEYANALVAQGISVTVWHSNAVFAFRDGKKHFRSVVGSIGLWWWSGRRRFRREGVKWFSFDPRVSVRSKGSFPHPQLSAGDAVLATAVQTAPLAARLTEGTGARSAVLIQHYETWADSPAAIAAGWAAVDERIVIAPWLGDKVAEAGLTSHLIPNALIADDFPIGPALEGRKRMVLSLLAPHGYKRPDVVIGVLSEVARRSPGTSVVTFGQSPSRPTMPEHIEYVSDPSAETLRKLYQSSQVYFCGSDAEGWHLPPAEATLSGAAVVSTDIGGVRASMGNDALYAPPGDVDALATEVLKALDDTRASSARLQRARDRLLQTTYASNASVLAEILEVLPADV